LEKIREKRRRKINDENPCTQQGFLNYPNDRILRKKIFIFGNKKL